EVMTLKNAGISEDTILAFIKNHNVNYELDAQTIISLRDQGLPTPLINAMVSSGGGMGPATTPTPAPVAPVAPVKPVPPVAPIAPVGPISPVQPVVAAPETIPDVSMFYSDLNPYGRWRVVDGQWAWQPTVSVSDAAWQPYWNNGHWVYTDAGWYWAS